MTLIQNNGFYSKAIYKDGNIEFNPRTLTPCIEKLKQFENGTSRGGQVASSRSTVSALSRRGALGFCQATGTTLSKQCIN